MGEFNVVGLNYEDRRRIVNQIIESHKTKGNLISWQGKTDLQIIEEEMEFYEFEEQFLKGVITLKKEPTNPYDPNAIKVYMTDGSYEKHHIGYISKEDTEAVSKLMKNSAHVDAEVRGSGYKFIDVDVDVDENDDEYEYVNTTIEDVGITIHMIDIVEATKNNPFVTKGDGSPKAKMLGRIGCSLMLFILLVIIVIIFS